MSKSLPLPGVPLKLKILNSCALGLHASRNPPDPHQLPPYPLVRETHGSLSQCTAPHTGPAQPPVLDGPIKRIKGLIARQLPLQILVSRGTLAAAAWGNANLAKEVAKLLHFKW
eukprot:1144874-Pelagomonas_calceolata.AAC.2